MTVLETRRDTGSALARCTGDPDGFLSATWGRAARVHPGVDAAGYSDLLTFDDVDRILTTTSIRTPSFRLVRSDRPIAESEYTRSGRTGSRNVDGMIDVPRALALFRDGATIVLQGVHRWWDPVGAFARALEFELGHPAQVNAYITPPGAQGLALHEDPHDVFVLHAFGRKRWQIHAAPREAQREPLDVTIEAGDALYLPTGTPHAATAQETLSGHLTIGVHVTPWREVLAAAWKVAEADASLDEPVPARWTSDPDVFAAELARRLAAAAERLGAIDAGDLARHRIDRFLSTRSPSLRGAFADELAIGGLDDTTTLRRREGTICDVRPEGQRVVVLLGDRRLEMPAWLEPAMRRIAGADVLSAADLAAEVPDAASRLVLVRRLVREGLLRVGR